MLEIEYKRDMYQNYLVIKEQNPENVNSYVIPMLLNNCINGILPLEIRTVDHFRQYYYDITSRQPLSLIASKERLSRQKIQILIIKLIEIIEDAREYFLEEDDFIVDAEYIFVDMEEFKPILCYVSGYHVSIREQFIRFMEYLMNQADYQDEGAVLLVYGLYQLSREEDCTFEILNGYMREQLQKPEKRIQTPEKKPPEFMPEKVESEKELLLYTPGIWISGALVVAVSVVIVYLLIKTGFAFNNITGRVDVLLALVPAVAAAVLDIWLLSRIFSSKNKQPMLKKKTEYLPAMASSQVVKTEPEEREDSACHTTVLNEEEKEKYQLIALDHETYKDIRLTEFPFFIGKLKSNVDYSIENNTVSRFHAKLERAGDDFYIMDLNSTNGTFVNHIRLEPNEKTILHVKDVVTFSDVSYRFVNLSY